MTHHIRYVPPHVLDNLDTLKAERLKLHLSQSQLAKKIGISTVMLQSYELAYVLPSQGTFNRMAKVLHWQSWD